MPERSVRFSVRGANGCRAATWKLLTLIGGGKSDVYLTCRSLGGALKTSLHQSGSWHVGFVRSYLEKNLEHEHRLRQNPYLDRWPRPTEISPGLTLAYRIIVPIAGINVPIGADVPESLVWIPAAPQNKAVEIAILFASPHTVIGGWPGRKAMGTDLVGKLDFESGETVWIVSHVVDVPSINLAPGSAITWFRGRSAQDFANGFARVILFGDEPGGSRYMVDMALQIEEGAGR